MKKKTIQELNNYVVRFKEAVYDEENIPNECVKFSVLVYHLDNIVNIITRNEREV